MQLKRKQMLTLKVRYGETLPATEDAWFLLSFDKSELDKAVSTPGKMQSNKTSAVTRDSTTQILIKQLILYAF